MKPGGVINVMNLLSLGTREFKYSVDIIIYCRCKISKELNQWSNFSSYNQLDHSILLYYIGIVSFFENCNKEVQHQDSHEFLSSMKNIEAIICKKDIVVLSFCKILIKKLHALVHCLVPE